MSTLPDYRLLSTAHIEPPSFRRFIVLSLLLHLLVVLLFGDAGGSARRGERLWGAFRATLEPITSGSGLKLDRKVDLGAPVARPPENPPPAASSRPAAEAITPASADATATAREGAPPAPPKPGNAPTSEVLPYIVRDVEKPVSSFVVAPPTSMPDVVAPAAERPRLVPLQNVDTTTTPPQARELAPFIAPKPREEEPVMPRLVPLPAATIGREAAPPTLMPRILPAEPTPALTPLSPAKIEREYAPVAEPLPRLLPVAPVPLAAPTPLSAAKIEREYAPVAEPLVPVAPLPPAALPRRELAPYVAPKIERESAAPADATPTASPESRLAPTVPADNAPREAAVPGEREPVPQTERSAPEKPSAQAVAPGAAGDTTTLKRAPPSTAGPRLDMDAVRNRARDLGNARASEGTGPRTVLPFPTPPPGALKSKDAKIFDKALKRPDCRDAYAGMGLAAVIPLVADAISNKGCKW